MAIYCKQAFQKTFEDEVSKKAYLDACKWLAQNIYGNVELSKDIVVNIAKTTTKKKSPAFTVTVYVKSDADEVKESFCKKCRQLHTIFYSVDGVNCNECKGSALYKKLESDVKGKAEFVNEILEGREDDEC